MRNYLLNSYFLCPLLTLFIVPSCHKDSITTLECARDDDNDIIVRSIPEAVIGERIPNPLDISIVWEAFNQLAPEVKSSFTIEDIKPTHKYVAFTPSTDEELGALDDIDETIVLLSAYPLDYEVSDGVIVPDPRFMINGYSYRWAYVPIDYDLSKIECPFIYYYDICCPWATILTKSKLSRSLADALERKAYELCGIELKPVKQTKSGFTPYGRVRFYDSDVSAFRGVEGLSIRTVRAIWSSYTHCDSNGYFTATETYNYAFRYEIHFSRTDFSIRKNDTTSEVIIKYSDYMSPLYKDISDDEYCYYANISRAAIVYYYGDNCGLRRPPMRSDNTLKLAIQANLGYNLDGSGNFTSRNFLILEDRPIVTIYRSTVMYNFSTQALYGNTMHELGHSSHWRHNQANFNASDHIVKESFAAGVEWILTSNVYPSYAPDYYRLSYTGIVQDLIDGYGIKTSDKYGAFDNNNVFIEGNAYLSYNDHVTGFTPSQIEEAVRNSRDWDTWRARMIVDYPDVANVLDIWSAFSYWNTQE
ncbi:MAG: hypothetical protein J6X39_01100 [Bacteroidales bacterium]|nr:hypothetical protein [Bacteroidales bacterium]